MNWVTLKLQGTDSNRLAIGARINILIEEHGKQRNIYRTVGTGGSFGSNSLQQEIGLGYAKKINNIQIYWPSGRVQNFENLGVNSRYYIEESGACLIDRDYPAKGESSMVWR